MKTKKKNMRSPRGLCLRRIASGGPPGGRLRRADACGVPMPAANEEEEERVTGRKEEKEKKTHTKNKNKRT